MSLVASDHSNIRLVATSNRKRTKTRPLELAVPELPCSRVIATALASTICQMTDSAPGSSLDWASLVAFEDGPAAESELGTGSGSGPGSVVGPAEGAASDGQLVPTCVDHWGSLRPRSIKVVRFACHVKKRRLIRMTQRRFVSAESIQRLISISKSPITYVEQILEAST
jgi:hypothetical protein